jgi:N-acetylneuraminic acid mutarotase
MDGRARRAQLAAISTVLILAVGACTDSKEDPGGPAPMPVPRTEVAGTAWRGGIAVAGGFTGDGSASDAAHSYNATADQWRALPRLPASRHHATLVELGGRLYILGGFDAQSQPSDRVWSLGADEPRWRAEPPLPVARAAHATVVLNGRIIVTGGVTIGGPTNQTVVFREGFWGGGPPLAKAREHLAATVAGGRVYVIGGREGKNNFTDVESWDSVERGWRVEPSLNDARGGIGASTVAGHPCVAGGEELRAGGDTIGSVECLRSGTWARLARLERPRHGLAVVAVGDELHVIGGGRRPGLTVSSDHEVLVLTELFDL